MTIKDVRGCWGSWPCALCDSETVEKRGTICPTCELKLDAARMIDRLDEAPQLRLLDEPAHPVRGWQDVTPRSEYL